jgi:hypothetical protein
MLPCDFRLQLRLRLFQRACRLRKGQKRPRQILLGGLRRYPKRRAFFAEF